MDDLRAEIRSEVAAFAWYQGVKGLTLRIDRLKTLGASPQFLDWWRFGRPLDIQPGPVESFTNHPSLRTHLKWAELEWERLERLGKVEFYPKGTKPTGLHVNPCALLLKLRPDAPDDAPEEDRYKPRLLCDLLRSRINIRLPK